MNSTNPTNAFAQIRATLDRYERILGMAKMQIEYMLAQKSMNKDLSGASGREVRAHLDETKEYIQQLGMTMQRELQLSKLKTAKRISKRMGIDTK
jgi:hypothetical protein